MSRTGNFDFKEKLAEYKTFCRIAPKAAATIAVNFFQDSFTKQGFDDNGVNPWENVQRRIEGTKAYKYPKKKDKGRRTRAILVKTGRLRRSIRTKEANFARISIVSDLPYARVHNEGIGRMAKRQFMGRSRTLERMQMAYLKSKLDRFWDIL